MMNVLKTAFEIDYNYKINAFLYNLKKIPLLGKVIPSDFYSKEDIKRVIRIFYILFCVVYEVVKKIAYIGLLIILPFQKYISVDTFILLFMLYTFFGGIVNTEILAPKSKKYYTVLLMGMDAGKYVCSHLLFFLAKTVLSFLPALLIFLGMYKISLFWAIPLLLFLVTVKITGEYICLQYYLKRERLLRDNIYVNMIGGILLIAISFGLCYLGVSYMESILHISMIITTYIAYKTGKYLWKYPYYRKLYKETITLNKIFFDTDALASKSRKDQVKIADKDIEVGDAIKGKSGYAYFNAIFFTRHRRILLRSARTCTFACLAIALGVGIFMVFDPNVKIHVNRMIMTWLPYFIFIMYLINRGAVVTQAMFMNCDNSMLTYNFYRDPKTILSVFKTRVKTVVAINLLPGLVIASALPILLFMSGGTSTPLVYISLFLSIIFMSVFFSVHHLVLYYLLQPYDINMKAKSSMYTIINSITYVLCYLCIKIHVDTAIFSVGTIALTAIYMVVSLFLVYRYASKTFRLK